MTTAKFCSQCGNALTEGARFCAGCGTGVNVAPAVPPTSQTAYYCPDCEATLPPRYRRSTGLFDCPWCGYVGGALTRAVTTGPGGGIAYGPAPSLPGTGRDVSAGIAYLLWAFLGGFGVHRFYLGDTGIGLGIIALNFGLLLLFWPLWLPVMLVVYIVEACLIPGAAEKARQG